MKSHNLSVIQRSRICKKIPAQDWQRFDGHEYVAVSSRARILDADDDRNALVERVERQHPQVDFFTCDGKTKPVDRSR